MSNGNKGTATLLAVLVTLAVAGGGGYMLGARTGQSSAQLETSPVATVNGDTITKNDLYERMASQNGKQALGDMINEKLVDQAAKAANITLTPADLDAEINKIKERVGGEQKFQEALASNNLTLDQLKQYQAFRLKATKILSKDIALDDAALQKYFEENKAQFDKREVHARHVLVNTEEEAKAIKLQLDKGADFAALAKEKSTEPSAKQSGGDLGWFGPGKMVPEFEQAVFGMKKGEISQPVKTQFGYHVIQLLETKGAAPDFNAMKGDVKDAMLNEKVAEKMQPWLDELRQKAKITNTLEK